MFRIGEFSKIAQVSGRLLRYYDEIGLLAPEHIDEWTGYRYYTADQLPRLNRILALKELGLTLDQVARLLDDAVTADEIRGMLTMRKAQIEQSVQTELFRLRQVEVRLSQIENEGRLWPQDVVIKDIPAQRALTYRRAGMSVADSVNIFAAMQRALPGGGQVSRQLGLPLFVLHSPTFDPDDMDMEMGFFWHGTAGKSLPVPSTFSPSISLTESVLPAVASMATIIHTGWTDTMTSYSQLGTWVGANGYEIVGPTREVVIAPSSPENPENTVLEIQFPVVRAGDQ